MPKPVRCSTCGFLTRYLDSSIPEIRGDDRRDPFRKACSRAVSEFVAERLLDERDCVKYIEYSEGYNPEEHLRMLPLLELQKRTDEQAKRTHRTQKWGIGTTLGVGVLTTLAVVAMGLLNYCGS